MIIKCSRLNCICVLICIISINVCAVSASFKSCSNVTPDTGVWDICCTKEKECPSNIPGNLRSGQTFSSEYANVR